MGIIRKPRSVATAIEGECRCNSAGAVAVAEAPPVAALPTPRSAPAGIPAFAGPTVHEQLAQLSALRSLGVLNEAEFVAQKVKLLASSSR